MAAELVRVNQAGGVTWHSAVAQAAGFVTPWGAAATVATQLAACVSEIGKVKIERERLARTHAVLSRALDVRQRVIVEQFEAHKSSSTHISLSQDALITGWHKVVDGACDMTASNEFREVMSKLVVVMSDRLVQISVEAGNGVVKFITAMNLKNVESDIAILRQLP
jgi:hypothetical protein